MTENTSGPSLDANFKADKMRHAKRHEKRWLNYFQKTFYRDFKICRRVENDLPNIVL